MGAGDCSEQKKGMINVDCSQTTHIGLCAGYGGIELGLRRAIPTLRSVALCEIEAFACANLVAKMEAGLLDPAPIWTDLKTFPWESFRDRVDILTGGYPCQPFSTAGRREGENDPRHLWPFIASGIRLLRPRICFFENVEGHISLGLPNVIEDLAGMGYRTTWGIFSASEVGAPHQRKRVFILAHCSRIRLPQLSKIRTRGGSIRSTANRSQLAHINEQGLEGRIQHCVPCEKEPNESATGCRSALAHANSSGGSKDRESSQLWATRSKQPSGNSRRSEPKEIGEGQSWPSRPGEQQFAWEPPRVVNSCSARQQTQWDQSKLERTTRLISESNQRQTESSMGRDADGSSDWMDHAQLFTTCDNRTDELRLLGNGVVPATAERAFRVLMEQFA